MGMTSRNLLLAMLVASVPLAVSAFLPWYDFGWFGRSGPDVQVFTRFGDGYILAGLAVVSGLVALLMLTTGRVTVFPALALIAATLGATMLAITNLAFDSDVCNADSVLGFMSGPQCGGATGGDNLSLPVHGQAGIFLWWAAALSLFMAIGALALPLTAGLDRGNENTEGLDEWA